MSLNQGQYTETVLKPARRAHDVPPADLYTRYGLSPDLRDPATFARDVAEVVAYWRELAPGPAFGRLAEKLLAEHRVLERSGDLTLNGFAEQRANARRAQLQLLTSLVSAEAGANTHVGPAGVARISAALDGTLTQAEIEEALGRAGVTIVQKLPVLPRVPHPKIRNLRQYLEQLRQKLSASVVFGDAVSRGFHVLGGFRLADGRRLDEDSIAAASTRISALPFSDPARTPSDNVLAVLRSAARTPGDLDALLLSEIVEELRPLAEQGFLQKALAGRAEVLGLDADEAGLIAAALLSTGASAFLRQQVEEKLAVRSLREAQRLSNGLPADDPVRQRVSELTANVTGLSGRADLALVRGRGEEAATLLAQAIVIAEDDPDLSRRLAAIPPPPPVKAEARPDGDHVLITWTASPATTGQLHYQVVRGNGRAPAEPADGTAVAAPTMNTKVADTEAPPGADLFYSVFASRGGKAWSPATATPAMRFAPDVADIAVTPGDTWVTASWRPHPGTDQVVVVRRAERPPQAADDSTPVETLISGFTDKKLSTGTEYWYRVTACYRTPDGRSHSPGKIIRAVPEPEPAIVSDLTVSVLGGGTTSVLASWTTPRYGRVRLVRCEEPPPWPPGTRLSTGQTARLRDIPGTPWEGTDGQAFLEVSLPPGRHHLLALTTGRTITVAGNSVPVRIVESVSGLVAERLHDQVQLAWVWPAGATDALVCWPGGECRCSRRAYFDEGGVIVTTGPVETTIEVRAVYPEPGHSLTSPPASVSVPGRGVAVRYRIRRESRWNRRRRAIAFATEQATALPALIVVRSTGRYPPDDPAAGEMVKRLELGSITPDQPLTILVETAKGLAWLTCFVDPADRQTETRAVLLFPPPEAEMRLR